MGIPSRSDWDFNFFNSFNTKFPSKEEIISSYIKCMYNRTVRIFKYENLPETIKQRDLELLVQMCGYGIALKHEGKVYILKGGLGGRLNEQFLPTLAIVTNPYLNLSKQYEIGKDCVVFKNDSMYQGLSEIARRYATLLAESEISFKYSAWNSRILTLIGVSNDKTAESAQEILDKIVDGRGMGIISQNALLEEIKNYPYGASTNTYIKQLLELHQYLKANWFIELGLNANYNMKRESLSVDEVGVNEDTLFPLIDDMLASRKIACEELNKMFGLNISVDFDSSWKRLSEEVKLNLEGLKKETDSIETQNEQKEDVKENEESN